MGKFCLFLQSFTELSTRHTIMARYCRFTFFMFFFLFVFFFFFLYLLSVDAVDYCAANPTDIVPTPDNCAQYYNCTERNTFLGNHTKECKYPDLFSTQTNACQNFETVHCAKSRTEPQAPCKSCSVFLNPHLFIFLIRLE